jgi:putative RNA 2'-phosphotransferase
MERRLVRVSKFLSFVLRHRPEAIGLALDQAGWASVDELIRLANAAGHRLTRELIAEVVAKSEKSRFSLSPGGQRIRANYGHSAPVRLGLEPVTPPDVLYHGTATRFIDSILSRGLLLGNRQYVHLSSDAATARTVGRRHGKPVILLVESGSMHAAGFPFYRSESGIWLTGRVPAKFLKAMEGE